MGSPRDRADANRTETLQWRLDQHRVVTMGHDAVHPDRSECGGIGNCRLMATEHDSEREITDLIDDFNRRGLRIVVTLERVKA